LVTERALGREAYGRQTLVESWQTFESKLRDILMEVDIEVGIVETRVSECEMVEQIRPEREIVSQAPILGCDLLIVPVSQRVRRGKATAVGVLPGPTGKVKGSAQLMSLGNRLIELDQPVLDILPDLKVSVRPCEVARRLGTWNTGEKMQQIVGYRAPDRNLVVEEGVADKCLTPVGASGLACGGRIIDLSGQHSTSQAIRTYWAAK